jgi:mannosyltransferase OCH1-like enzyme
MKFVNFILIIVIFILIITINNNKDKFDIKTIQKIPKIIIQTWKDNNIPTKYHDDIKSIIIHNRDYEFIYFNDNDIEKFLMETYPNYFETYKKLPFKIQRIDFFRYVAVYHYGGFYFDLDMTGFFPLDELLIHDSIFSIDTFLYDSSCDSTRVNEFCNNNKLNINYLLGQYAFGASIKNEFIKFIIDGIHDNIDKLIKDSQEKNNFNKEYYIYKSTGPDYVTKRYLDYKDNNKVHILHYYEQTFGKYAKHNCYGSWKDWGNWGGSD